jgi:hypothetical protein
MLWSNLASVKQVGYSLSVTPERLLNPTHNESLHFQKLLAVCEILSWLSAYFILFLITEKKNLSFVTIVNKVS